MQSGTLWALADLQLGGFISVSGRILPSPGEYHWCEVSTRCSCIGVKAAFTQTPCFPEEGSTWPVPEPLIA